ncbi:MAG: hypothetical protein FMNOHCHN_02616 [Ignavibacteriaceae bacterium]|nr:hypothetical protein [Ignavibacteriaceae bacterium]
MKVIIRGGQCQNFGTLLNAEGFSLIYNSDWGYKTVYLEQTKYNSSIFSGVLKRWWNNGYLSYTTRKTLSLKENSNIILAADTNLIENFKFKEFENTTIQRVLNENTPPQNTEYKSLLVDVKNSIVINNQFESTAGYNAGQIEFKDPWFAANSSPYLTPPYGYSNLGLNAVFHSRPSPFNPKSSGSDIGSYYKGVFLNQSGSPDWLPPNYSIRASASGSFTVPSSGRTHYFHFLNWISNPSVGAEFQYPENLETAVSFKQDNTTVSALYKGIQLSNNPETYTNNGQQHFVRVKNSYLYSAYESMGKLFIEEKMPNGAWTLMNNGKPIIQEQVFSSSLDFVNNGTNEDDKLLLAYTSQNSGYPVIGTLLLNGYTDAVLLNDFAIWQSDNMHTPSELQPIVAVNGSIKFMIVFRRVDSDKKGLFFFPGTINGSTVSYADSSGYPWYIHGTNQYSVTPTISVSKTAANEPVYWIAWQQNSPSGSSSDIYYKQVTVHSNGSFTQYGGMMSGGSGYPWNRYPTITSIGNSARVAWQGYVGFIEDGMNKTGADEMEESRIIFKSTDWWQYWQFGYNVHKPNINRHDAENGYIFGWSQNGGQGIYFANNTTLSTISTVTGLQGFDVQISNGTDKSTMVANSYKTTQQPYFFTSSNGLSTFMKEQNLRIGSGREGIIRKGDVIFKYLVGDISRNGQEITFKAIPDTINLNSLGIINSYLETEPFTVNSNTELLYSVGFMVSDSVLGAEELNEGDEIKFTLTINDAESGQQVALLDEVTYTKNALGNYGNIAFRATMEGMPETPVKLKLTVQSNFEHISSLARRVNVGDVVEKSSTKTIAVASPLIVTEYLLSQNYPNPFNPVTEIEFALPEQSDVTLKVYDILGKEIATLASGNYSAGRYTVPFDGTSHASGVYIYKLNYGKGQSITRKMTLLK